MCVFGLLQGGGFYLLGIQVLAVASQIAWTVVTAYLILKLVDVTVGLRVPLDKEILGADYCEHGVGGPDRNAPEGASEDDDPQDNGSPRRDVHFLGYHGDYRPEHHRHHRDVDIEVVERKVKRRPSGGYCGHSFRQKHRVRLPKAPVSCCCHCCHCQCHRYDEVPSDCENDSDHELENVTRKKNASSCCRRLVQRCKNRQGAKEDGELRHIDTHLKDVSTNTASLNVVSQEIVTGL
ncbi:Hypp1002 [Branchiostoma lanceolatum]|uniref:Hypp1002 protein n=1 Tax=Branchiostoma lanceolatum TaxID=7740 RepID=A0A8J9ZGM6_BRALA|nr:Hypp1002 [Branchiostoma lanceolatum]